MFNVFENDCLQNNSKTYGRILMKFSGNVDNGTRNRFQFSGDPDHCLYSEFWGDL